MATKRMFSNAIVNSSRFLRMGQTARLLYYDLGMAADDAGVVEAFVVMRTTGASEDDLRVLAAKGFVTVLNEDLVSYISDWNTNNNIRNDRRQPSIYNSLLVRVLNGDEIPYLSSDRQMPVKCPSNDRQMTAQISTDKIRLDKGSIEGNGGDAADSRAPKKDKPIRHKYGQYNNVLLSDADLEQLKAEFPSDWQTRIERLSEYIAQSGKSYKSHLATIRAWARRDACFADAKFRAATFASDDGKNPVLSKLCRRYADAFSNEAKWLLLYGGCGVGKTFSAAAIANALIDRGLSVRFTSISEIERMLWNCSDKQEVYNALWCCDFLILDDFGCERATEFVNEIKFNVLDGRLRSGRPAIITTNLCVQDFSSPQDLATKRIYSRIFERVIPYEVRGVDRRFENLRQTGKQALDALLND